jgi:hypothetical protein
MGYLDESMHYAMDIEYWLRAGERGMTWLHVPENLGRFRLIAGTKSLSSLTAFWPDYLEIFRRHRGVKSLHRFFGFYHYNLAHEHQMDLDASQSAARAVIEKRWSSLAAGELAELPRQERQGFARACALLASELYRQGHPARADEVFSAAPAAGGSSRHHLAYRARRAMGGTFTRAMDQRVKQLAKLYRSFRYDYRYLRG